MTVSQGRLRDLIISVAGTWHDGCFTAFVMNKTSTILAIGSGLFLSQAQAEIESEFHVGYNSEYVFRGNDLGSDAYEFGLDFSGSCDCGFDWSAGIWSITPDGGDNDELDIYGEVSKDLGFGSVAVGFASYQYDGGAEDDSEVYLGLSAEPVKGFEVGFKAYFGVDGAIEDQILLEGALGYTFIISPNIAAKVGVVYGYMADEGVGGYSDDEGSVYGAATLALDIAVSEDITFSPYVAYVDGEEKRLVGTEQEGLIGGAKVTFKF